MPLINTRGAASIKGFGFAGFSPTVPFSPSIGSASTTGATTASVSFTAGCSGGLPITGYQAISSPGCITATGSSSPISVSGLTHSTSYTFKVRAQNSLGYGPYSGSSNSITTNNVVPNAPTSVSATATSCSSATVSFTGSSCNGGASIDYYQAISSPGCITATGTSPISISGLSGSTSYTFRVRAHNSVGYGCYSSPSSSITTPAVTGSQSYVTPGSYSWVGVTGVTSVSAVAVGAGGSGSMSRGYGGGGGGLGYLNNRSVTPGCSYTVVVGVGGYIANCRCSGQAGGDSYFISSSTVKGGGGASSGACASGGSHVGTGGGNGGAGGGSTCACAHAPGAGGGAGGYSGAGGKGVTGYCTYTAHSPEFGCPGSGGGGAGGNSVSGIGGSGGGGGVGIFGQGSNGTVSPGDCSRRSYGGGGGSCGGTGGQGGVPGTRQTPTGLSLIHI